MEDPRESVAWPRTSWSQESTLNKVNSRGCGRDKSPLRIRTPWFAASSVGQPRDLISSSAIAAACGGQSQGSRRADLDAADRTYRRWARTQMKSNRFAGFIVDVGEEPVASGCVWLMQVQPSRTGKGHGCVSSLDVHGAGPHRGRGHGARIVRETIRFARARGITLMLLHASAFGEPHLHPPRIRTNNGDAFVLRPRKTSEWARGYLRENRSTREMTIRSVRARKPSNTTLIMKREPDACFPMTTAYDVPPVLLIETHQGEVAGGSRSSRQNGRRFAARA